MLQLLLVVEVVQLLGQLCFFAVSTHYKPVAALERRLVVADIFEIVKDGIHRVAHPDVLDLGYHHVLGHVWRSLDIREELLNAAHIAGSFLDLLGFLLVELSLVSDVGSLLVR